MSDFPGMGREGEPRFPRPVTRRRFLEASLAAAGLAGAGANSLIGAESIVQLPFENGERPLVQYPQKRPLLRLTSRPPQLETPFEVFAESALTPNDAFFVRYHLPGGPPSYESLASPDFRLRISGAIRTASAYSLTELRQQFEWVEVVAVNQCSGNSRGFFKPRVPGGQLGHGAVGNARWGGVRLKDVLERGGLLAGARQIALNGLDVPQVPGVPDFVKAMDVDRALEPDLVLAMEMNGAPLPWLNGFPLRLVVPGHYGTYWIKHLHDIQVLTEEFKGFWMNPAYRIPDDPCAHVAPGTTPKRTVPIQRFNVRSFITSPLDGGALKVGAEATVRGIAFDGGHGIREVVVSDDGGKTWRSAELGKDLGRYSFREWSLRYVARTAGEVNLMVRATNRLGESQPMEPLWNPAGYMRNCVESVRVMAAA